MIQVIPAIDIIDGKCVRLSRGDYSKCKIYSSNPLDQAKIFEDCGSKLVHIVDLDGAKASMPKNLKVLELIASKSRLDCEFGGGIKSRDSLCSSLNAGATRIICGSIACKEPQIFIEWLKEFGPDKILFGADLKNGVPAISGWLEQSNKGIDELLNNFIANGLKSSIVTDISKDGMLQGPSYHLYSELMKKFPTLDLVASGGISSSDDIRELDKMGIKSVIAGKAIYEGRISADELKLLNNVITE